jgi:hypothetical protein
MTPGENNITTELIKYGSKDLAERLKDLMAYVPGKG